MKLMRSVAGSAAVLMAKRPSMSLTVPLRVAASITVAPTIGSRVSRSTTVPLTVWPCAVCRASAAAAINSLILSLLISPVMFCIRFLSLWFLS